MVSLMFLKQRRYERGRLVYLLKVILFVVVVITCMKSPLMLRRRQTSLKVTPQNGKVLMYYMTLLVKTLLVRRRRIALKATQKCENNSNK